MPQLNVFGTPDLETAKQTLKPATHCLGTCALTSQAMLASKMMLDCGSDTRKSVLVVALIEPFKD
jgi:hypothetical protein